MCWVRAGDTCEWLGDTLFRGVKVCAPVMESVGSFSIARADVHSNADSLVLTSSDPLPLTQRQQLRSGASGPRRVPTCGLALVLRASGCSGPAGEYQGRQEMAEVGRLRGQKHAVGQVLWLMLAWLLSRLLSHTFNPTARRGVGSRKLPWAPCSPGEAELRKQDLAVSGALRRHHV